METTVKIPNLYDKPQIKSSNKDLSQVVRNSMAPGILYPMYTLDILPGDKVNVDINSLLQSNALKSPLFGSVNMNYEMYFVPTSAYKSDFHNNIAQPDLRDSLLPKIEFRPDKEVVNKSSLYEYLYMPQNWRQFIANTSGTSSEVAINLNAERMIAYYDIWYNYYANFNEPDFLPIIAGKDFYLQCTPLPSIPTSLRPFKLSELGNDLQTLKNGTGGDIDSLLYDNEPSGSPQLSPLYNLIKTSREGNKLANPFFGLMTRCYQSDRNTSFLSQANYDKTKAIKITDGMSIDEMYTSERLYDYYLRLTKGSGRFKQMIEDTFDVTPKILENIPTLLGSFSHRMTFDTVLQTAPYADTVVGERLGTGSSFNKSKGRSFNFDQYGTFMIIGSIVPDVDYYQGMQDGVDKITLGDIYNPSLDGISMQPLKLGQLLSVPLNAPSGNANPITFPDMDKALGYQPAWTEYTSRLNRNYGDLADDLNYWTFSRNMLQEDPDSPTGAMYIPATSTYITPWSFNLPFAIISQYAENWQCQSNFIVYVKRKMSNQLQPQSM